MPTTTRTKPPLIYSLPINCPIRWPAHAPYAVATPARDLSQAYLDSASSSQPAQSSLDAFASLLLSAASDQLADAVAPQLRSLILPLHDFDRKWRSTVPDLINSTQVPVAPGKDKKERISEKERDMLVAAHAAWKEAAEKARFSVSKGKEKAQVVEAPAPDMPRHDSFGDSSAEMLKESGNDAANESEPPQVDSNEWLTARELYETRLQALILLTLISLPVALNASPVKARKKKDPERHAATLDPQMLLDFLTDRLQIWRVMQDVSGIGLSETVKPDAEAEEELDEVQRWWKDVVELHYTQLVSDDLLSHHRAKLFPSASPTEALARRTVPEPSPFKDRSLLSLDKSARRRERAEEQQLIAQSPTMKRLIGRSSNVGPSRMATLAINDGDTFKIPAPPKRKAAELSKQDAPAAASNSTAPATNRPQPPRKQERPRPLYRSISLVSSSKGLFNRREVSLSRRPSGLGLKKKRDAEKDAKADKEPRRRKSASPKKMNAPRTLVPDTPTRERAVSRSITRAPSMPNFAALGAAARPGAEAAPSAFVLPPLPKLPRARTTAPSFDDMDWEAAEDEDERFLKGFEKDARQRRERETPGTPVTTRQVLVPAT